MEVQEIQLEKLLPVYSTDVLVGNWYEDRISKRIDKHAITPGIYGKSGCISDISAYKDNFRNPKPDVGKAAEDFLDWNQVAFRNKLHGGETSILLNNGEQFEKNMTTMTDILYRIKPAAHNVEDFDITKKKPKEDLMKSYGNATVTGYRRWKGLQNCCDANIPIGTTFRREFKPKQCGRRK